ncbi:MAG TPA: ATP-dependent helicase C-terminal domain-containing protein [Thermoanaerobaculia bacterium]|nr:ATP-dependent helicase C-terminal domain-containing protein [Thermoanaerobaculia bacterium]
MLPLPIDEHIEEIRAKLRERRAVVIVAPPGAGKTTRVPPALVGEGTAIVLQPRRIAARSLARRIASERGWTLGDEVGWHVRFDRKFTPRTRLLIATEGILTARMQSDPLLGELTTVVIDEFHERSIHADLGLALARQAMLARDDLRLVVMSATIDAEPVARFLGGCPIVRVEGRLHPVEISYEPELALRGAVSRALARPGGHVLVFLPGAPEIRRAVEDLRGIEAPIFPLHGSLSPEEQDAAIAPSSERKVILATNLAETSLTVEGVTDVIDTGLQKVLRYDSSVGIDRLETERIPADSAEQRAGRAGRTAPGRAVRLWDARMELRAHREPEIARIDLAGPLLEVIAWGADPHSFEWFEPPPTEALERDLSLLEDLGAIREGRVTGEGKRMLRLPLHPRHARVMLEAGGSREAAAACAILSEGLRWAESRSEIDLLDLVAKIGEAPAGVRRAAQEIARRAGGGGGREGGGEEGMRRALFAGYADRLAQRRESGSGRFLLAHGTGAAIAREGWFPPEPELAVALDLLAPRRGGGPDATIRLASVVERSWVHPTHQVTTLRFDPSSRSVRAVALEKFHEIVLRERPAGAYPDAAAPILADLLERLLRLALEGEPLPPELGSLYPPNELADAGRDLRRARVAGVEIDPRELAGSASAGRTSLPPLRPGEWMSFEQRRRIDALAPDSIAVPSGRSVRLDYRPDGGVVLAVKLQELFGLADSPRVGPGGAPVTIELLAPSGRPVQTTNDLRSFWSGAYHQVRRELRGRYPKHPWPEDPWTAPPTRRTRRS